MLLLRMIIEKLQMGLSLSRRSPFNHEDFDEGDGAATGVPEDVKEGHFVVRAVDGGNLTRFIVDLSCLSNPQFLRLLQEAEEEFGFKHEGALVVPCRPDDLRRILGKKSNGETGSSYP